MQPIKPNSCCLWKAVQKLAQATRFVWSLIAVRSEGFVAHFFDFGESARSDKKGLCFFLIFDYGENVSENKLIYSYHLLFSSLRFRNRYLCEVYT